MVSCILCSSTNLEIVEKINSKVFIELYYKRLAINIQRFFIGNPSVDLLECSRCKVKFYSPQIIGDGKFYSELQKLAGYYLKDKEEYSFAQLKMAGSISPKVLDIGCGEGHFYQFIPKSYYTGLELNEMAILNASRKGINVLGESIEEHVKIHRNVYDYVCYFQVLEHVENPREFITQSLKALKNGGKLIFAVPSDDSFLNMVVNHHVNGPPHHVSLWTDSTFYEMEKLFNLKLLEVYHERLHSIHYGFYGRTLLYWKIKNLFGIPNSRYDNAFSSKLIFAISYPFGILYSILLKYLGKKPIGQSVIAVFEKS
jgi:SAM-dependent methyltransferase